MKRQSGDTQIVYATLGKFDRFMMKLLRVKDLPVRKITDERVGVRQIFSLYWASLREYPISLSISIIGVIVGSSIAITTPYIFKKFLDILAGPVSPDRVHTLITYAIMILSLNLVAWVGWRASYISTAYIASGMLARLRQRAFGYLMEHSHRFFTSTFTGSLVQKVNRFAVSFDRLEDRFLFDIIPIVVEVSGIMYILSREHWSIAAIIILWLVVFVCWNYAFARWKLKFDVSRAAQDSLTSAQLADSITNQQTVELYRSQDRERGLYAKSSNLQSLFARFSWQSSSVIDGVQAMFIVIVEFAIFYVGVHLWSKGQMSIGMFVLAQTYILQLSNRLWSFSRMIRDVYESLADAKEMAEIMRTPHEITDPKHPVPLPSPKGEIEFRDVGFSFNEKKVLKDFCLSIKAGEKVALVGVSGAGKSTIIKLLFRQYDPESGAIYLDETDIKSLSLRTLRNALSLVPQDPVLFHRSLMENIRYGKPGATDDEVIAAAKLAHCDDFIDVLPQKYETLVGERGVRLSGGERQRVAIARAFLRNSPILVLDEATSSLDSQSEEKIQDALMLLMQGKTTVIIAHRLSTIRRMDRIIVLSDGKIIEDGSHDQLLEKGGAYRTLWDIQQGGFLKDDDQSSHNAQSHRDDEEDS